MRGLRSTGQNLIESACILHAAYLCFPMSWLFLNVTVVAPDLGPSVSLNVSSESTSVILQKEFVKEQCYFISSSLKELSHTYLYLDLFGLFLFSE